MTDPHHAKHEHDFDEPELVREVEIAGVVQGCLRLKLSLYDPPQCRQVIDVPISLIRGDVRQQIREAV